MVLDANSGAMLHQSNADEPRYPASLTKMMTLYIAFDLIEQGRLSHNTRIAVSETAAGVQPTKLGVPAGRDIALIDAMKALVTKSANDMAVAIAEHIAGSEEKFAALMTQRARQIGMPATTFKNAHGLPDRGQVTTARDMLTLALRLQDDFPRQYPLFALKTFSYGGETMRNHNTLLFNYEGVDGIKTGYTQASGYNVVTSYHHGSKHLVGVVFGGASASSRNQEMRTILTRSLTRASVIKSRKPAPVLVARAIRAERRVEVAAREAPVAAEQRPRLLERPSAVERLSVQPAALTASAEPVAASAPKRPAIEMARVRPVLVAPRAPLQTPTVQEPAPPEPDEVRPVASAPAPAVVTEAAPDRRLRSPPFRGLASESEPREPAEVIAQPALARPILVNADAEPAHVPFAEQSLTITPRAAATPAAVIARPTNVAAARPQLVEPIARTALQPVRGSPPSTFQQQVASLEQTPATAPQRAAPDQQLFQPASAAPGGVRPLQIQIGAFSNQAEAERQLGLARQKAGGLLDRLRPLTIPVQADGRQVFRARYAGVAAADAPGLCSELRRRQIDCLVARE